MVATVYKSVCVCVISTWLENWKNVQIKGAHTLHTNTYTYEYLHTKLEREISISVHIVEYL